MKLQKLTDRIYYLPFSEETDRPNLGYIRGDRHSLMIDAGNSPAHVKLFLQALIEEGLPTPDFCVLTHWHWDHTFGAHALKTLPNHPVQIIASTATNKKLKDVATWEWTDEAMKDRLIAGQDIEFCDRCIRLEYSKMDPSEDNPNAFPIQVDLADLTFDSRLNLDLGGIRAKLFAIDSPHSLDSVLISLPEEHILFIGDAAGEDHYDKVGQYDPFRLNAFINRLHDFEGFQVLSGHGEPEPVEDLLEYLGQEAARTSTFMIRSMLPGDAAILAKSFCDQGWSDREETLNGYYTDQQTGVRYVYIAELNGIPVGYVTLLPRAIGGPYGGKFPEICDFNVLQIWQKQGIGSALMDAAESQAFALSGIVTLAVGLHSGYGAAQKMYAKRGYVPDGSGVWFQGRRAEAYGTVENDDDLVLFMRKKKPLE